MLFIEYPPCSTCKKAKLWLRENGVSYTDRHIKEVPPTYEELKHWYQASGLPLKRFFNTSGLAYKTLNLKEKLPNLTQEERPLLITEKSAHPGFREEAWGKMIGEE